MTETLARRRRAALRQRPLARGSLAKALGNKNNPLCLCYPSPLARDHRPWLNGHGLGPMAHRGVMPSQASSKIAPLPKPAHGGSSIERLILNLPSL